MATSRHSAFSFSSSWGAPKLDNGERIPTPNNAGIALETADLYKSFKRGRQRVVAVDRVSLTIRSGEVLAFLGPNGAGKTTTIKMIAGLIRPDRGHVSIAGADPHQSAEALRKLGAILEGNRNLYWRLTAVENLEYFGVLRGLTRRQARQRGINLLKQFGLLEKASTPVKNFSRGMQQKLAIAIALVHDPKLLLLDEPTLGLDVEAGEHVKQLVRAIAQDGCAVLLTTHQLDVAEELSDRVAVIRQGQIVAEADTEKLIQAFSGSSFCIEVDADIDAERQAAIARYGARVSDRTVHFRGEASHLYKLLDVLKPLPLVSVTPDRPDLTEVFLRIVRGEAGQNNEIAS